MSMLHTMLEILPIGPDQWKKMLEHHIQKYPGRDLESMRYKYNKIYQNTVPTGQPHCPPDMKLTKRIEHQIGQKASLGNGQENFNLEIQRSDSRDSTDKEEASSHLVNPHSTLLMAKPFTTRRRKNAIQSLLVIMHLLVVHLSQFEQHQWRKAILYSRPTIPTTSASLGILGVFETPWFGMKRQENAPALSEGRCLIKWTQSVFQTQGARSNQLEYTKNKEIKNFMSCSSISQRTKFWSSLCMK